MGTFIGHAGPAVYFIFDAAHNLSKQKPHQWRPRFTICATILTANFISLAGLWFFWRSLDTQWSAKIRKSAKWLSVEPALRVPLSMVVVFAEIWYIQNIGYWHTHAEHMLMSLVFAFGGLIRLLHTHRILTGNLWAYFDGLSWGLVGYLFYDHGISENRYLTKGHALFAYVIWLAMILMWLEATVARYSNKTHWKISARRIETEESSPRMSFLSKLIRIYSCCCCSSNELEGTINPLYSNPTVYATPLSGLYGFLIFWSGTWQFDLGAQFLNEENFTPAMTHVHVGHSHDAADAADAGALQSFLTHLIVNGLFLGLLGWIAGKIDRCSSRRNLAISDEFAFLDEDSVPSSSYYHQTATSTQDEAQEP